MFVFLLYCQKAQRPSLQVHALIVLLCVSFRKAKLCTEKLEGGFWALFPNLECCFALGSPVLYLLWCLAGSPWGKGTFTSFPRRMRQVLQWDYLNYLAGSDWSSPFVGFPCPNQYIGSRDGGQHPFGLNLLLSHPVLPPVP